MAKILIVEDEGITGVYIKSTIEELGYVVTSVELSGEEAIESINREKPDLILMDIILKGEMDGIMTAEAVQAKFDIPVIYLTAHSDKMMLERAKITEPFGYVIKPFDSRELFSCIEMALYKHEMERKVKELAHYDGLTGLVNRYLFLSLLDIQMSQSRRDNNVFALLYLDLDDFKYINDTHGHDVGDLLLKEAATRVSACVRDSDTVSRLGGDEFTIIARNISTPNDAVSIAKKVIFSIGKSFRINKINCSIGISIGIALFPSDARDKDSLLKKADDAMYMAKNRGKNNFSFYGRDDQASVRLEDIISLVLSFVLNHKGQWNHSDWLELIMTIKREGFDIRKEEENYVGFLAEAVKDLYNIHLTNDRCNYILNTVCNAGVKFIEERHGVWHHSEWEAYLKAIEKESILIGEDTWHILSNILEGIKSLYISYK